MTGERNHMDTISPAVQAANVNAAVLVLLPAAAADISAAPMASLANVV